MIVGVRGNPLKPPLLETNEATWIDVRDESGALVFFVIFPPGKSTFLTCQKGDSDFEETARGFSIPLQIDRQ